MPAAWAAGCRPRCLQNQTVRRGGVGFFGSLQENIRPGLAALDLGAKDHVVKILHDAQPVSTSTARSRTLEVASTTATPSVFSQDSSRRAGLELHILQQLLFPGNLPGQALLHRDGQIVPGNDVRHVGHARFAAVIPGVLGHGHALTVPVQQFVIQSMGDDLTVDQQTI